MAEGVEKTCSELALIVNELKKLEQKAADNQEALVEHLNAYLEGKVKRNDKDWLAKLDKLHAAEVKLEEKSKDVRMRLVYEKQFLRETVYASKGSAAQEIAEKTTEVLNNISESSGPARQPFYRRFSLRGSTLDASEGEAGEALWEVPADEIELHRSPTHRLGQGSFGEVYRGTLRGKEVAIKVLKYQEVTDTQLADFRREIGTLSRLRHPHIILFMGACSAPGNLTLITELMAKGSVADLMKREPNLAPILRLRFCKETALAMNWMHKMRPPVLHLDLKTSNLLVDQHYNIKVSDFGLAEFKTDGRKTHQGSGLYMAPEVLLSQPPTEKSDVFSYAITCAEILTFTTPYKGRFKSLKEITEAVANDRQRPDLDPKTVPGGEPIVTLVKSCWEPEPGKRPTFQDIVSSNIFDNTILDMSISAENPIATKFWKRYFKGKMSVNYDLFVDKLMQFCEVSFPPSDIRLLLFKDLLADQNNDVLVDAFGKVLDWFGPMAKGAVLFNSVREICLMPGFQGHLSSKEAESLLQSEPKGAYLIRFSSQDPGFFAFSVTQGKELNHYRVIHRPGGDFAIGQLKFDSLKEIPSKAKKQLKLGNPVLQSRYTRIEESTTSSAGSVYQMLVN